MRREQIIQKGENTGLIYKKTSKMLRVLQFILTFPPPTLFFEYIPFLQFSNYLPKVPR